MKHIFSNLTVVAFLAVAMTGQGGPAKGREPEGRNPSLAVPRPADDSAVRRSSAEPHGFTIIRGQEPALTGQQLVARAAKRLANEKQISAELRYTIDACGHELHGTGKYLQRGAGEDRLLRLDLRMQVGDKPATLLEIRGSELYWLRRELPPAPASLERLNLMQLRKALTSVPPTDDVLPEGGWIVLGGLPRLLAGLEQHFAFAEPESSEVQYVAADGHSVEELPIWIVQGKWKPDRLAALTNRAPAKLGALPEQLPDRVEVVLGRTADLPLFPFRVTYGRALDATPNSADPPPATRELLTLELFNVSTTRPLDPRDFLYQPSPADDPRDITTAWIQRLSDQPKDKKLR